MTALEKALEYSRKLNIDECEVVSTIRKVTTVRITDSEIFELKQNFEKSYGVRIIQDKKITSIQTSNEDEIQKSVENGLKNISSLKSRDFWKSLPTDLKLNNSLDGVYDKNLEEISGSKAADIAQSMINSALDSKILAISGSHSWPAISKNRSKTAVGPFLISS